MNEKETGTMFIAGFEVDAEIAEFLLDQTLPSIKRVVEEMTIAGNDSEVVKAAANAAALAITETAVNILCSKGVTT